LKEVADYAVVDVPTHTTVDVPGFRVDTVQDNKLVEVEEHQPFALRPVAAGNAEVVAARELGALGTARGSRTLGAHVYHPADDRIAHLDVDHSGPSFSSTGRPASARTSTLVRRRDLGSSMPMGAGAGAGAGPSASDVRIGFQVRDGDGKRAVEAGVTGGGGGGVIVSQVVRGDAGERAGLRVGDLITHVNNKTARTATEFRNVVAQSTGPLLLRAKRRGGYTLSLTVHR